MELGPRCSDVAVQGLKTALSYVGGALIYIRRNYADRLRILSTSWVAACKRSAEGQTTPGDVAETVERPSSPRSPRSSPRGDGGKGKRKRHESGSGTSDRKRDRERNIGIPATFSEMFRPRAMSQQRRVSRGRGAGRLGRRAFTKRAVPAILGAQLSHALALLFRLRARFRQSAAKGQGVRHCRPSLMAHVPQAAASQLSRHGPRASASEDRDREPLKRSALACAEIVWRACAPPVARRARPK